MARLLFLAGREDAAAMVTKPPEKTIAACLSDARAAA